MKRYIEQLPSGLAPELHASKPYNFHEALRQYLSPELIGMLTTKVLEGLSVHAGYIAEIKSKKWIYLGENHQRIPTIHLNFFDDYFLTDYGLTQMLIVVQE